jgi:hypothetical protein
MLCGGRVPIPPLSLACRCLLHADDETTMLPQMSDAAMASGPMSPVGKTVRKGAVSTTLDEPVSETIVSVSRPVRGHFILQNDRCLRCVT